MPNGIRKELIIPAFSDEAYRLARQRANDCHNHGAFAYLVTARQYSSPEELIQLAQVVDPQLVERAICQGIVLDQIVGEKDFGEKAFSVFQLIARQIPKPCFLVKYSHPTACAMINARSTAELKKIKEAYWETHGIGLSQVQVLCPAVDAIGALSKKLEPESNVIVCVDTDIPFKGSWVESVYQKFDNVIVIL